MNVWMSPIEPVSNSMPFSSEFNLSATKSLSGELHQTTLPGDTFSLAQTQVVPTQTAPPPSGSPKVDSFSSQPFNGNLGLNDTTTGSTRATVTRIDSATIAASGNGKSANFNDALVVRNFASILRLRELLTQRGDEINKLVLDIAEQVNKESQRYQQQLRIMAGVLGELSDDELSKVLGHITKLPADDEDFKHLVNEFLPKFVERIGDDAVSTAFKELQQALQSGEAASVSAARSKFAASLQNLAKSVRVNYEELNRAIFGNNPVLTQGSSSYNGQQIFEALIEEPDGTLSQAISGRITFGAGRTYNQHPDLSGFNLQGVGVELPNDVQAAAKTSLGLDDAGLAELVSDYKKGQREIVGVLANDPQWERTYERLYEQLNSLGKQLQGSGQDSKQDPATGTITYDSKLKDTAAQTSYKQMLILVGKLRVLDAARALRGGIIGGSFNSADIGVAPDVATIVSNGQANFEKVNGILAQLGESRKEIEKTAQNAGLDRLQQLAFEIFEEVFGNVANKVVSQNAINANQGAIEYLTDKRIFGIELSKTFARNVQTLRPDNRTATNLDIGLVLNGVFSSSTSQFRIFDQMAQASIGLLNGYGQIAANNIQQGGINAGGGGNNPPPGGANNG